MRERRTGLGWIIVNVTVLVLLVPALAGATIGNVPARASLAGLSMPFVPNRGQIDPRVAFYAPTFAGTLFVTTDGELVYALSGRPSGGSDPRGFSLVETLEGGRARPVAQGRAETGVSYFVGSDPARWRAGLPTHDVLSLGEVWSGVAVSLHARGRSVEKVFTLSPGTPVDRIRVRVSGASGLSVDEQGALVAQTRLGAITFTTPVAYQERDGERRPVTAAYRLQGDEYSFTVGAYDERLPLVIDPLLKTTFLGGGLEDSACCLTVHPLTGEVYVTGATTSGNFPGTIGGAQSGVISTHNGAGFVARLNSTLTSVLQTSFIGGASGSYPAALVIHPQTGDVYVTGSTKSSDFAKTAGGAQPNFSGIRDAFVMRLNRELTDLVQSTFLGGIDVDDAGGIAIHPTTGDVYVAGQTLSQPFPGAVGGAQQVTGSAKWPDVFVTRLNSGLTSIIQSTYFGGNNSEFATGVAIHPVSGDVYVGGYTFSVTLPGTAGGIQATLTGTQNIFVARFNRSLTSLTQATYLGAGDLDYASGLAIHPMTGDIYIVGSTGSVNFPGTAGGAKATSSGGFDAYVARLNRNLTELIQATYLGGSGADFGEGMAIHPVTGDVYITGGTSSGNLPATEGAAQTSYGGAGDGYVARLNSSLTALLRTTYVGGGGVDAARGVAISPLTGDVYVAGLTGSASLSAVSGAAQTSFGGGDTDGFVSRLTFGLAAIDPVSPSVVVNQETFKAGQTLSASVGFVSPALSGAADVYLGILGPTGSIVFFTPTGTSTGTMNNLSSFRPVITAMSLATPRSMVTPNFFSYAWTGSETRGDYILFCLTVKAGTLAAGQLDNTTILGLSEAPFTFQ